MKYSKKCQCCGHVVTAYTHKLWRQQIEMLWKLINFHERKWRPAIISELWLTPVQYSIFWKMKHFDLIKQEYFKQDWKMKLWRIPTWTWKWFYLWKNMCPNRVASMNGETLPWNHEAWKTDDEWRKRVRRKDIEFEKSKQPVEYKEEKGFRNKFKRLFDI